MATTNNSNSKKKTSRLGELVRKRTAPGAVGASTEKVRLLIDVDGHTRLRADWEAAEKEARQADIRLKAIEANPEIVKARTKMNDKPPVEAAREEVETAREKAAELRAEVQECFIVVTVRGLTSADVAEANKLDEMEARKAFQIDRAVVSITDVHGDELHDLDAGKLAKYLHYAAAGEEERVWAAINAATKGVDFPT